MESLFFNLSDKKYKKSTIEHSISRVDISQGTLYLDAKTFKKDATICLDYIDTMCAIFVVKRGKAVLNCDNETLNLKSNSITIFAIKEQKFDITFKAKSEIFILFVSDFFLKNYLSSSNSNLENLLYSKLKNCNGLEQLHSCSVDTLSSYLIEKLINLNENMSLLSLKAEMLSLELLAHFLQMLQLAFNGYSKQEFELANRAKEFIEKDFLNPPTIKELAKLCQTNETKLKRVFKKVFESTIYNYLQEFRLQKAYYLLKNEGYRVGEVANAVGYLHQGNFSKLFKERFGVEPSLINKFPFLAN